ncbi:uncharacterized protein LOC144123741 [Amblyomma americanum]
MNVRLATQLFSRSVAIGLKFYKEQREPGFEGTEGTEKFTLLMNELFDALNAKCPIEGIRRNSPKIKVSSFMVIVPEIFKLYRQAVKLTCGILFYRFPYVSRVIRDFLDLLNTTERNTIRENTKLFASQQTTESLRVTLLSVLDIIALLHQKEVLYVLTAKLNQDPLERFFGVVRSFGGDEDHPTITHFSQIFRLLSLYTPLKMATKGNCSGDADPVLVSVEESLNTGKLAALAQKQARQDWLDEILQ